MPAQTQDITIHSNEWFELRFTWLNADHSPIDLNGYQSICEIGVYAGCEQPRLTLTSTNGDIALNPITGGVTVIATLDRLQQANIVMGTIYKYKLSMFSSSGKPKALLTGKIKVIC